MTARPVIVAALVISVPASAKTPDELTPSVETLCDQFEGRAYGLCTSYCEARDCDDPRVHAADASCNATERQFKDLTGRDLFCTTQECTIKAIDDTFVVPSSSLPVTVNVLSNDEVTNGTIKWADDTQGDIVNDNVQGDLMTRVGSTYIVSGEDWLSYTACCSDTTCDTAVLAVTVEGC